MLPHTFPDKRAAITAAFLDRFAIGFVIGVADLTWPLVWGCALAAAERAGRISRKRGGDTHYAAVGGSSSRCSNRGSCG